MTTIADVLRAARAKIERPEAWMKGNFARDKRKLATDSNALNAVCWDSAGAVYATPFNINMHILAILLLRKTLGVSSITAWNDASKRTHAEVLAAFDRAILAAEQESAR